jgi:protein-tyrosine-phosphatase
MFRSRIAEEYSKSKEINAYSAGLITCPNAELLSEQVNLAKEFNLDLVNKSKPITMDLLKDTDKIIIIADDIPKEIFVSDYNLDKIIVWKIRDVEEDIEEDSRNIIKQIIKRIDEELLNSKQNEFL